MSHRLRLVGKKRLALVLIVTVAVVLALMGQDTRIIGVVVWGLGVVGVWLAVFIKAIRQFRAFRDRRARGEVRSDGALFIVAVAAGLSISVALFTQDSPPDDILRQFSRMFSALALGMFLAAGLVKLTEAPPDPPEADVEGHRRIIANRR